MTTSTSRDEPFQPAHADEGNFLEGVPEGLRDAVLEEGRAPFEVVREAARLSRKPNRLTIRDYFAYRLYRRDLDPERRRTFVGERAAADLHRRTISGEHVATARDKILFHQIMSSEGLPVPRIIAYCHPYRSLSGAKALRSREEAKEFLLSTDAFPLFSKPARERRSEGAQIWVEADASTESLVTMRGSTVPIDDLLQAIEAFELAGYLFQEVLRPDPRLERICGTTVSTVRVMVVLDDHGPHFFRASWKVPVKGNLADNFWRPGNLLASLDRQTGEVQRVVDGFGAEQKRFERHPDTDATLTGSRFPEWESVRSLALEGARLFPGVGIQSWDITLADRGPVAVELNYGGDSTLVQLAHDRGIYDRELREILARRHDPAEAAEWWS